VEIIEANKVAAEAGAALFPADDYHERRKNVSEL
jgi:hypothetical protein